MILRSYRCHAVRCIFRHGSCDLTHIMLSGRDRREGRKESTEERQQKGETERKEDRGSEIEMERGSLRKRHIRREPQREIVREIYVKERQRYKQRECTRWGFMCYFSGKKIFLLNLRVKSWFSSSISLFVPSLSQTVQSPFEICRVWSDSIYHNDHL